MRYDPLARRRGRMEWHTWFAWFPVPATNLEGKTEIVWLEKVYRKNIAMSLDYVHLAYRYYTGDHKPHQLRG